MHLDAAWAQAGLVAKVGRMKKIKVLDHGYVKYIAHLGSDEFIIENARTSTGRGFVSWEPYKRCKSCDSTMPIHQIDCGKWLAGPGTRCGGQDFESFPRGDSGILEYLYKNRHTSPFEFSELVIEVQAPMDVWRQWIRHRTASVNEYSTRYSEAIDLMHETPPDKWRTQGKTNRQGSGEFLPGNIGGHISFQEKELHKTMRMIYEERIELGVAKEQARKDLPLSTYTKARWKIDLHNLLHFLGLRMHSHAQWEIRQYANAVAEIAKEIWPRTFALFEEHSLYAVHLSRAEAEDLRELLRYHQDAPGDYPELDAWIKKLGG